MKQRLRVPRVCLAGGMLILCLAALLVVSPLSAQHHQRAPWSENVLVSDPQAIPRNPVVAVDDAGQAYAAWQDARSGPARGIYVASRPVGSAWGTPTRVPGSDLGNPSSPTIAARAAGALYVAWVSGFPDTRADIRFAWSTDGGLTWEGPVQVNPDVGDIAGHPDLAVDARGNVHLVWSDLALFGDPHSRDVKWSMRSAGQDSWTEPVVIHPDVDVFTEQGRPAVTVDRAGNVYAIWEDARHGPDDPHAIYAAALLAGSGQWGPGRRVDRRPGKTNARPDIASGPDGTVYAVWDTGPAGVIYSAVLRRGARTWDEPAPLNSETEEAAGRHILSSGSVPRVAVDGHGIAYVAWQDSRTGDADVYAAIRWPPTQGWGESMRVNDDVGTAIQETPAIAADEAGRVVAVWNDQRGATSGAVYVSELQLPTYAVRLSLLRRQ